MTSIPEARFQIERELLEFCAGDGPPLVEQVDAVLSDEGDQIFFHVHLVDRELTSLMAVVDLPRRLTEAEFDRRAYAEAFWNAGAPSLTRN